MAVSNSPIFPVTLQTAGVKFVTADGITAKPIFTAGVNGSKVEVINVSTDDTAAKTVQLYIFDGTNAYALTQINIPATSGFTTSLPPVAVINNTQLPTLSYDSNGNKFLYLKAGWSITCAVTVAMTAAKTLHVVTFAEDF